MYPSLFGRENAIKTRFLLRLLLNIQNRMKVIQFWKEGVIFTVKNKNQVAEKSKDKRNLLTGWTLETAQSNHQRSFNLLSAVTIKVGVFKGHNGLPFFREQINSLLEKEKTQRDGDFLFKDETIPQMLRSKFKYSNKIV